MQYYSIFSAMESVSRMIFRVPVATVCNLLLFDAFLMDNIRSHVFVNIQVHLHTLSSAHKRSKIILFSKYQLHKTVPQDQNRRMLIAYRTQRGGFSSYKILHYDSLLLIYTRAVVLRTNLPNSYR